MKKLSGLLLCAVAIAVFLAGCGSSTATFESQVKRGNYSRAIDVYQDKIVGNSSSENSALSFLREYLEEGWQDYADGTISDQDFLDKYTTLEKIDDALSIVSGLDSIYQQYLAVKESKESYLRGIESVVEGELPEAIEAFSSVISEDIENYDNAQSKLEEATETYQQNTIENAKQLASSGDFKEAVMCVTKAEEVVGQTSPLEDCLTELYTKKYTDAITDAYDAGDDITVIREYSEATDNNYVVISSELTDMYVSCSTSYLEDIGQQAETEFGGDKDYDAAISVLRASIAEIDTADDLIAEIEQLIDKYKEYVPVALASLEYTQKASYIAIGDVIGDDARDVNGTAYDASTVIHPVRYTLGGGSPSTDDESYVLYNLNFKYSTFSGVLYRPYSSLSCDFEWSSPTVKVYGDDVLLYEAPDITQDTYDPINFEIDVTGVRNLKIVMNGVWGEEIPGWVGIFDYYPKVCMAYAMLQK